MFHTSSKAKVKHLDSKIYVHSSDKLWSRMVGCKNLPCMKLFTRAEILGINEIIVIYFEHNNSDLVDQFNLFGSVLLNDFINGDVWITTKSKKKLSISRILNLIYLRVNNPCPYRYSLFLKNQTNLTLDKNQLMNLQSLFVNYDDGKMSNNNLTLFCRVFNSVYDIVVKITDYRQHIYSRCLSYMANKKIVLKEKYKFKSKNRDDQNQLKL